MERDPAVYERYKKGKARAIGAVAQGLLKKARDGDTTSAIFYLKTQAGWKEKQDDAVEQKPIEIRIIDAVRKKDD